MHGRRTNGPSIRPIVFLLLVLTSSSAVRVRRADGCGWCCSDTASPDRWCIVVAGGGDGRTARARRSRALDSGGGQWRARSRSTRARARYCSHQFTCRSRQAPADRIPAAVVCRGHNMPAPHGLWHAHGAYTARLDAGAATTTRISRAGTTSPGERERRRERAPMRKGTSPVGLAVAFAMAPLTSRKG